MLASLESKVLFEWLHAGYAAAKDASCEADQELVLTLAEDIADALYKENMCFNRKWHLTIVTGDPHDLVPPVGSSPIGKGAKS